MKQAAGLLLDPEDGSGIFLRNINLLFLDFTTLCSLYSDFRIVVIISLDAFEPIHLKCHLCITQK
jgi:hypothetical protein